MSELFAAIAASDEWQTMLDILPDLPFATWESFYATVLTTVLALVIGLPLGVLLVVGDRGVLLPLPRWLMTALNVVINLLRSVPFLILMIMVQPLSRVIMGTTIGTVASIVPLVAASFPFVARLVETSLREVDGGVIEAAQSMGATPFQIIAKDSRALRADHDPELRGHGGHHRRPAAWARSPSTTATTGYQYLTMVVATVLLGGFSVQLFQSAGTWLAARCDKRTAQVTRSASRHIFSTSSPPGVSPKRKAGRLFVLLQVPPLRVQRNLKLFYQILQNAFIPFPHSGGILYL